MLSFTATIKTNNGTYEIDQKTNANNEVLFCVMHNSGGGVYFSSIPEALNWIQWHSQSNEFTPKEREINDTLSMLADNATNLLNTLEHGTPMFYQVRLIANTIDELLERIQLVK
jgi:hypothetical protein